MTEPTSRDSDDRTTNADAPTGGDELTEDQLDAENEVEEETLKTLDPDSAPA